MRRASKNFVEFVEFRGIMGASASWTAVPNTPPIANT
jgi:hypothetical protein